MRRFLTITFVTLMVVLAACGGDDNNVDNANENNDNGDNNNVVEDQTFKVAVVESPMTDVVDIAKDILADEGIDVEVVEMGDYIQPNEALANGEIDVTFSQHVPFMEQFNENTGESLAAVEPIYFANFGLYAREYDSIDELPEDVTIGIANDPSNIDRSLRLLESHGLIELEDKIGRASCRE